MNEYLPAPLPDGQAGRLRQAGWTDQNGEKKERFTLLGNSDRDPLVLLRGLERVS